MASRMYRKCIVCHTRQIPGSDVFLAALPLDPVRCRLWVQAIGLEDLVHVPIEKLHTLKYVWHFGREDFNEKGNRLLQSAVPKYRLPLPPLPEVLFADFPLHVGWVKQNRQSGVLRDSTNLTNHVIATSNEEHATAAESTSTVVEESSIERTSIVPKYGKRKFDDIDVGSSSKEPQPSTSSARDETCVVHTIINCK